MSDYTDDSILDPNEYEYIYFDNGKICIVNSDDEPEGMAKVSIEDWIDKNNDVLQSLFDDFGNFPLCTKASFSDFCEYIHYGELTKYSDIQLWIDEMENYSFKMYNLSKPSLKEFAAHYYETIIDMYTFLERNSSFCIGPVEDFIDFVYLYSHNELK